MGLGQTQAKSIKVNQGQSSQIKVNKAKKFMNRPNRQREERGFTHEAGSFRMGESVGGTPTEAGDPSSLRFRRRRASAVAKALAGQAGATGWRDKSTRQGRPRSPRSR
jgi:hypothetical protein